MNIVRLLVLVVAVGAGFVAFSLVMDGESQPLPILVEKPVVGAKVLVAAKDIPLGGKLVQGDITWIDWPKSAIPEGALTKDDYPAADEKFIGNIVRGRIFSGEPIRAERLISTDKGYMAAILPKGKRAIAVGVEQETSAGGFILPGDKVDVILTRVLKDKLVRSETILENIRVLAIDSTTAGEQEAKNLSPQRTATLELSLNQSEIVIQAQKIGSIALALRSAEDSEEVSEAEQTRRRDSKFVRVQPGRWSIGAGEGDVIR